LQGPIYAGKTLGELCCAYIEFSIYVEESFLYTQKRKDTKT